MNSNLLLIISISSLLILIGTSFASSIGGVVSVKSGPPYSPTISASIAPNVNPGQTEIFTANIINGTSPYTYNFYVINSVDGSFIANYLITNTLTNNAFSWYVPSAYYGNTIQANVVITDNNLNTVASSNTAVICIGCSTTSNNLGNLLLINRPITIKNNEVDYAALTIAIFAAITCMGYVYYSTNKSQSPKRR